MKLIPLSQGKFAKVDDADFEWLSAWKWYCDHGRAVRNTRLLSGKYTVLAMPRVIMGVPQHDPRQVDHEDLDPLNNQRSNLRVCTGSQNQCNQRPGRDNTSGFKRCPLRLRQGAIRLQNHVRGENPPLRLLAHP